MVVVVVVEVVVVVPPGNVVVVVPPPPVAQALPSAVQILSGQQVSSIQRQVPAAQVPPRASNIVPSPAFGKQEVNDSMQNMSEGVTWQVDK